jgi:hypothetical protein
MRNPNGFTRKEAKAAGNNAKGNKATIKRAADNKRARIDRTTKKNNPDNEEYTQIHKTGR